MADQPDNQQLQPPQFQAPNAYAFQPGQVPNLPLGVLPQTNPIQPTDDNAALQQQLMQGSQIGQQAFQEQLARQRGLAAQLAPLQQQQAALAPNLAYHPHMAPITGQGFGHDLLNFLGDLGKGALAAGAYGTRLGQGVQAGIYGGNRAQYQNLAQRIQEIQRQQQLEEQPLPSAAGLQYHPFSALGSLYRGQSEMERVPIEQQKANTQQQLVQSTIGFRNFLRGLDTAKLSEAQRHNRMDEQLRGMGIGIERQRNDIILSLGGRNIDVKQSEFDAAVNNKNQGFFDQLFTELGLKTFMGTGGQTQQVDVTHQQPGKTQKPQNGKGGKGGGTVRLMSGGRAFNIPKSMVGQFKKDHPDAR